MHTARKCVSNSPTGRPREQASRSGKPVAPSRRRHDDQHRSQTTSPALCVALQRIVDTVAGSALQQPRQCSGRGDGSPHVAHLKRGDSGRRYYPAPVTTAPVSDVLPPCLHTINSITQRVRLRSWPPCECSVRGRKRRHNPHKNVPKTLPRRRGQQCRHTPSKHHASALLPAIASITAQH